MTQQQQVRLQQQTRMTKQRMVILEELRRVHSHPTADEIYGMVRQRLPRISLGTVYRNLDLLAESGDILKLESAGSQKRFDGNITPHQHVRCTQCGRVGDVMEPVRVPDITGARAPGFIILSGRVEFEGVCEGCASKN
ncbi:Fur family transcriptional regulator [Nitratidesulfovibrio sp. 1201_IL3209]|uniref:Fur family transcriptional regulator n=1 Tax=Nitratidesulfovibrio sp. 1201_IL3209 TaxID=3084053 RepID=UPI002FDB0148